MDSKFIVRFSKIKNNRLLNRTQMVKPNINLRSLMYIIQMNQKLQKKQSENMSELISRSPMSASSVLRNSTVEEEHKAFVLFTIMKTQ